MAIGKIHPACKNYLWGGERLREDFGIFSPETPLAEAWVLSAHPDGDSLISFSNAPHGESFSDYIKAHPKAAGSLARSFPFFPMLIKLIDAKQALSIQVHPEDSYALSKEGQYGKTEMWIVLEREEGAFLYFGFQEECSEEEVRRAIQEESFPSLLQKVPVEVGDVFFIPAGTVHAIGAGIVLAEVQQNSNLTYRVYDYGRKDAQGNTRELHVEKALQVMKRKKVSSFMQEELQKEGKKAVGENAYLESIASCPYFTVERLSLEEEGSFRRELGEESFLSILVLEGEALLSEAVAGSAEKTLIEKAPMEQCRIQKGESFFLPAEKASWSLKGKGQFLLSSLRKDKIN
jgi:phosphomannose isomerase type I